MKTSQSIHRLNSITTLWSLVCQAHEGTQNAAHSAQAELLERYGGAVRRYLGGAVRDPDGADELFQEFACRFLGGDLRGADPDRGRFRDFVKGVLFHLIADHHKRRQRQPQALGGAYVEPAVDPETISNMDLEFRTSWRDDLLAKAWAALEQIERTTQQPWYTVLRFRAEHPEMPSPQMAEQLGAVLNKPLAAPAVRQMLHRAREKFADLLIEEVAQSLERPSPEQVESELEALGLLEHCRPALERREKRRR
jgi:RNA polymerase sigma-70 factor (ECF subfamily)